MLHRIDIELSEDVRVLGCPHCGGPLHKANYQRKPRGGPSNLSERYYERQSLCCGRKGCRRRVLPPSCVFKGRRVYFGAVILIVIFLNQQRTTGYTAEKLRELFGVAPRTLSRWLSYFRDEFPRSPSWRRLRGRVSISVSNHELPSSIVCHFFDCYFSKAGGLAACLCFLAVGFVHELVNEVEP